MIFNGLMGMENYSDNTLRVIVVQQYLRENVRYLLYLVVFDFKQTQMMNFTIFPQCVIPYLLVLQSPTMRIEERYILVMLLSIHFYYHIEIGQKKNPLPGAAACKEDFHWVCNIGVEKQYDGFQAMSG